MCVCVCACWGILFTGEHNGYIHVCQKHPRASVPREYILMYTNKKRQKRIASKQFKANGQTKLCAQHDVSRARNPFNKSILVNMRFLDSNW